MNIQEDVLVMRSKSLASDIHLGVIATQVATWASMLNQADIKLGNKVIDTEEYAEVSTEATEYLASACKYCKFLGYDWNVCLFVIGFDLSKFGINLK